MFDRPYNVLGFIPQRGILCQQVIGSIFCVYFKAGYPRFQGTGACVFRGLDPEDNQARPFARQRRRHALALPLAGSEHPQTSSAVLCWRDLKPLRRHPFDNAIVGCLQRDEQFMSFTLFRERSSQKCRVLYTKHNPLAPSKLNGTLFNVDVGTVWNCWRNYHSRPNDVGMAARLAAVTQRELEETIEVILRACSERRPLTRLEIDPGIRAKCNKVLMPDTLSHRLTGDSRVRCC
jgi:hypothetical protein